jgi:hypothetical protein
LTQERSQGGAHDAATDEYDVYMFTVAHSVQV